MLHWLEKILWAFYCVDPEANPIKLFFCANEEFFPPFFIAKLGHFTISDF